MPAIGSASAALHARRAARVATFFSRAPALFAVSAPIRRRLLIRGRVQGVFFRESTRVEAERLGVAGFVRNLPDGRVEVVVEGSPAAVEAIVTWARRGPDGAHVEGLEERDEPPQGERCFRVVR